MEYRFDWHKEKAKSNFKKHDIDFNEAGSIFYDPLPYSSQLLCQKGD